jgi:hypothetical protein
MVQMIQAADVRLEENWCSDREITVEISPWFQYLLHLQPSR